jgi:hypothetical protein
VLEDGIARHSTFVREYGALLEDSLGVLNVTCFSNEARFHLDSYINRVSDFGPQRIQGLMLPIHSVKRLQHDAHYQASEYSVPCPSMVQSLLMFVFFGGIS